MHVAHRFSPHTQTACLHGSKLSSQISLSLLSDSVHFLAYREVSSPSNRSSQWNVRAPETGAAALGYVCVVNGANLRGYMLVCLLLHFYIKLDFPYFNIMFIFVRHYNFVCYSYFTGFNVKLSFEVMH